jgi:hypothetical protein
MDKDKFTLKDLVVNYKSDSLADAFGVTKERAEQLAGELEKIFIELQLQPTWSVSRFFKRAADLNIATDAREVAFITYLVGCRVGEDTLKNKSLKNLEKLIVSALPPVRKGKYVN